MGQLFGGRWCGCTSKQPVDAIRPTGNPNPHQFQLRSIARLGMYWLVDITYPDCTNFEGRKILIMNKDPSDMSVIDPHFSEDGYIVARFAPTDAGYHHARVFLRALHGRLTFGEDTLTS